MPFLSSRINASKGFFAGISVPNIVLNAATNINQSRATLNATLNSTGGAATTITFEYKKTSDANYTSISAVSGGGSSYYVNLTGLEVNDSTGTSYTFRVRASNIAGFTLTNTLTFTTWKLVTKTSTTTTSSFNIPTITPTGGSAISVSIYQVALVGGGGGSGFGSGGGGGQLKSYASAAVNASGNNISWTIGDPGAPRISDDPGDRSYSGGTTSISGTSSTLSAPGGEGGLSDYPSTGDRANDGGASADNVNIWLAGSGWYGTGGKSFTCSGGGGGGAGGSGSSGGNGIRAGSGGAAASAYGLTSVGGGGDGFGNQGFGDGNTNHSGAMRGRGASAGDPNSILYPYSSVASVGGAVSFKYYHNIDPA